MEEQKKTEVGPLTGCVTFEMDRCPFDVYITEDTIPPLFSSPALPYFLRRPRSTATFPPLQSWTIAGGVRVHPHHRPGKRHSRNSPAPRLQFHATVTLIVVKLRYQSGSAERRNGSAGIKLLGN
jgi:hypothetical protein